MTEPQVWAVIAVLASMSVGTVTIVSTLFLRVLRAEIGGVRTEIGSVRTELRSEIGGLRQEMNARFETVDAKLDHLDRDVSALANHVFGAGRG